MRLMVGSEDRRTLVTRLRSGLKRRTRALWKRWTHRGPEFPVEAALDWLVRALEDSPGELRATCRETLLDYGCADVVSSWNEAALSMEATKTTGEVLERINESLLEPSSELAAAVVHWYKHGEVDLAHVMLRQLEARQTQDGSFRSPPPFSAEQTWGDEVLVSKYYLNAAQMRVAAAFDAQGQELPHTIDSSDGRMIAVYEWLASLPPDVAVADVGCGSGRFLIHLAEKFPKARLTGIDPCAAVLDRLPTSVHKHEGTLLRTGLADATFDAAFAVESLEHCLVAKRGIAELCRIVRPGGRLLVIDKQRSKQALSECEPWERWFHPHELSQWLEPFCDEIRVEPVSHGEGLGGRDLFLTARGRRY